MTRPRDAPEPAPRDRYPDALRAGALLVVVFGHWLATLPRLVDGRMVATEHLLTVWDAAGVLTWFLQVVPLFVFVSAAVSADGAARRLSERSSQLSWWAGRALGLARPTVTYLAVLSVLVLISVFTGARLIGPLDQSLTVHLWFLLMLLAVQALLPLSARADDRFGLGAVVGLVVIAAAADLLRGQVISVAELLTLGEQVTTSRPDIGWTNLITVWLLPQQLGIAWRRGRFGGPRTGVGFLLLGGVWLLAGVASGYPVAMVGGDLAGGTNVLPPTLALIGVMWLQVGGVLLFEGPARRLLEGRRIGGVVAVLSALSMPLYLWHKLAELPAAWLGEMLGAPIDAGVPGAAGFWWGRVWWVLLCIVMVAPVLMGVVAFESRRRRDVPVTTRRRSAWLGGAALMIGIGAALVLGARPGALLGLIGVAAASWTLRDHPRIAARAGT